MIKAGRETEEFLFDVVHIGMDMEFYHELGRDLNLTEDTYESFDEDRENAQIFVQNSTGTAFSCDEILNWYLIQSRTNLDRHLPPHALEGAREKGEYMIFVTFPIRFKPGMFHMATVEGEQDLSHLKLLVQITAKRRDA